jgi:hypothetical protein
MMTKEMLVFIIVIIISLGSCSRGVMVDDSTAVKALETSGFSEVKITKKNVFFVLLRGGPESDAVRFTCRAKNPAGKIVEVYVFSGWPFKRSTVRTD